MIRRAAVAALMIAIALPLAVGGAENRDRRPSAA